MKEPKAEGRKPKEGRRPKAERAGTVSVLDQEVAFWIWGEGGADEPLALKEDALCSASPPRELNLIFGAIWRK